MMVDAVEKEAELEEVTDVLLVTRSDDFNALAAAELRSEVGHGHVYRVAPDPQEPDLLPPSGEGGILGSRALTFAEISRRFAAGERFVSLGVSENGRVDLERGIPLVAVSREGLLGVAVEGPLPDLRPGDSVVFLA
jgi:hypothetical protein